jgi:hypothetical protein
MQVESNFAHPVAQTRMVKTKFKMDTIYVRLIILKFVLIRNRIMEHFGSPYANIKLIKLI